MSSSSRTVSVVIVLILVISGVGVTFYFFLLGGNDTTPTTTTTITTTSTTTNNATTTTTTATTIPTTSTAYTIPTTIWPTSTHVTTSPTSTQTTTTIEPKTLTILTRFDIATRNVFAAEFLNSNFAIQNGIVDIDWMSPASDFWEDLLISGAVDLCWGGGSTLFNQLATDGFLEPLVGQSFDDIADRINQTQMEELLLHYDESELLWIGSNINSFGVTINTDFLDTFSLSAPVNWTDLGNASYGSFLPSVPTIGMGNAPDTTSNCQIYQIILQSQGWIEGWELLTRMAGSANIYGGSVETQVACEVGDVGVSMSIDFYGYNSQSDNPDCQYIIPSDGAYLDCEPIAIANSSSDVDLAKGFIEFVMSSYGQSLFLDDNIKRLPSMPDAFQESLGIAAPEMYFAYNNTIRLTPMDFNHSRSVNIQYSIADYFEAVLTNAHDELVNCWDALVRAYLDSEITVGEFETLAALMSTPVTIEDPYTLENETFDLDYAYSINNLIVLDSAYRIDVMIAWTTAAKLQYAEVYSLIQDLIV